MADTNGNRKYTPEEEHRSRERAMNKGGEYRPPSKNEDAFMSPKWADVDKDLNNPPAGGGQNNKRTPEDEHRAQERAFNRGATSRPLSSGDDAFMSPKWADVDKNLNNPPPGGTSTTTSQQESTGAPTPEKRTYGAPSGVAAEAAARRQPLNSSYTGVAQTREQRLGGGSGAGSTVAGQKTGEKRGHVALDTHKISQELADANKGISFGAGSLKKGESVRTIKDSSNAEREARAKAKLERAQRRLESRGRGMRRMAQKPATKGEAPAKVVTSWLFFWIIAGIMIMKDIIDLALSALEAATTATVVGVPIAVFCAILGGIMTIAVGIIAFTYHIYTRKNLFPKFLITSVGALIGMIPILNLLPDAFIAFISSVFVGGIAATTGKVIKKVASSAVKVVSG